MKLTILVLEDEPEVRAVIERDLAEVGRYVRIEPAQDAEDAWAVVEEIDRSRDVLALVLADHRLPGTSGTDFLIELVQDERAVGTRTVLLTGQADQQDTIRAVNQAGLSHYLSKPWDAEELVEVVRQELTRFVAAMGIDPLPYMPVLDQVAAMDLLGRHDR